MTTSPSEPTSALATLGVTAPRRVIDDPRELDDEQLLEVLRSFNSRTTVVGAVGAAATAALAIALSPVVWFAAIALIPAGVGGFLLANRAVQHNAATQLGVTPRCLRMVEKAFDVASRDIDVRSMRPRDLVRTDYERMVKLVRAELALAAPSA